MRNRWHPCKRIEASERVRKGGRLMKWAPRMKGDTVEERGGRLQRTLMSQPFRQTTLLQPASAHMPGAAYASRCAALMAEGQGREKLHALASRPVNGGWC